MSTKDQCRIEWIARIEDYKAKWTHHVGMCSANNRSVEQLKYWLRKTKSSAPSTKTKKIHPQWVPLTIAHSSAPAESAYLVVRVGQAFFEPHPGFNPKLLREIVQALEISC